MPWPRLAPVLLLPLLLGGCSLHHWGLGGAPQVPHNGTPERHLAELEKEEPDAQDRALHLLQLALFAHLSGHFNASNDYLQRAKSVLAYLEAVSVTENLGAGTLNETLRSYNASPSERALVHQLAMLNFLLLGRPDQARVEALQADLLFQALGEGERVQPGQLASTRLVSGLVFELNGEWDNALIAYRKAREIILARNDPIPAGLERSLAQMARRLGLPDAPDAGEPAGNGDLVVLYWQGQISRKIQHQIRVYNPELRQHIALALPAYPATYPSPAPVQVVIGGERHRLAPLEYLERRVREDLAQRRPQIIAAASARLVAKHRLANQASVVDNLFGVFVDIALTLSEVADRRSWNSLPSHILMTRHPLPPSAPGPIPVQIAGQHTDIARQGTQLLLAHGASGRLFTFPSDPENRHD